MNASLFGLLTSIAHEPIDGEYALLVSYGGELPAFHQAEI